MPRENVSHEDHASLSQYRRELIAGTAGNDLRLSGVGVRVSNAPIFRDIEGALYQAVRVRVEPAEVEQPLSVRIGRGGAWLDRLDLTGGPPQTEFLFVPEVTETTSCVVELLLDDGSTTSTEFGLEPQRKWTVHLLHHSHYDIGYTDPQVDVLASQLTFIDDALELVTLTDDWPEDARFRWSIEVNWPLRHWLRTRPQSARDELVRRIHEGRIEINALPFSMHTEAFSFDELAQQLVYTQELRDELGVEITTAMQSDVPGATVGLSTLLTGAGIEFLAVAHNYAGRSIPHLLDGQDLSRPFLWQDPAGESLMVWYTDTLHGSAYMEAMTIGFGNGLDDVLMSLPEYLNALAQRAYPYGESDNWILGSLSDAETIRSSYPHDVLHLRVQGARGDNASPSLLPAAIAREWNEQFAWPRLVSSTNRAFHDDVQDRLGESLDTFSGDWTDWWADGIGSSSGVLGRNRNTQVAIRSAQTLNAIALALGDPPNPHEHAEFRTAYEEMALFDEHTWGAGNPWGTSLERFDSGEHQWIRKAGFAYTAQERVDSLLRGGIERLGRIAAAGDHDSGESIAVFNPNSWSRTDLVRIFIPRHAVPDGHLELVLRDSGRVIDHAIEPQAHDRHRPLGVWLHFLAEDVPPVGYVRYELRQARIDLSGSAPAPRASLANDHFEIALDLERGAIGSIVHRATGAELVDQHAPLGFNAYIHDRYTSAPRFNHLSSRLGPAQSWLLGARETGRYGLVTTRESNPVFERWTWRQTGAGADWIETTVTLPHGVPRVHLSNRLDKPSTLEKESVFFAFPFAGDDPRIVYEITGGVASPDTPHVPGSARHFRAIGHWATVESVSGPVVAWATTQAPLVQTGNIHLPYAPFPTTIPPQQARPGTILSWALNNIWDTNFPPEQGGELRFDYAIAVDDSQEPAQLGRDTGAAATQPLIGLRARRGQSGGTLPDRGSFVTIDNEHVEVTHLSSGLDGDLVLHLESHADIPVSGRMTFAGIEIERAEQASFLGADRRPLEIRKNGVTFDIRPRALSQVRLRTG